MAIAGTIQFPALSGAPSPPPVGSYLLYTESDNTLRMEDSSGNIYTFGSTTGINQLSGDVIAVGPGNASATVVAIQGSAISNTPPTDAQMLLWVNGTSKWTPTSMSGNATINDAGFITVTSSSAFTGILSGDVTGTQGATVVSFVDGYTAAQVGASILATQSATSSNTASTLVLRNASGNFSANIITAALNGNASTSTNATTAVNFTGSLSGDVTGTQTATSISSTTVTGKLLTGYVAGINTPILSTDSILIGFEKLQAQISASSGSAITSLTGDVTATGPGAAVATISAIQGNTISGTTGTTNVVFSNAPTITGLLNGGSASFSSTIMASNFSGNSSGTNSGDVTIANTNSIDLAFTGGQTGLSATLNISASGPDAGYIPAVSEIKSDGLLVEILAGMPVNIGTTNVVGSAASAARSDHVHALTATVTTGQLLTGYVTGTNTPIAAGNSILTAFENLQAQVSSTVSNAITSLTGDVVATGPGAAASTIQPNVVTNSKLAQAPADTLKGNNTGVTGNVTDLTVSQVNTILGSVISVGSYNGGVANANAATIATNEIFFQSASTNFPGMVDNTTQTFSGNKTFAGQTAVSNTSTNAFIVNTTSLVVDATNNAIGIGTAPAITAIIDAVNNSGSTKAVQLTGYSSNVGIRGRYANGTMGSPTSAVVGNTLEFISGRGYGTTGFASASTGVFNIVAGGTFTDSSMPTYLSWNVTPIGSVSSSEAMRLNFTSNLLVGTTVDNLTDLVQLNGGIVSTYNKLSGSTSGYIEQLASPTTATYSVTWPSAQAAASNYVLTNNGSGVLSWAVPVISGGTALASGDIWVGNASNVATAQSPSGDLTMSNTGVFTLDTVNSNIGSFASVTINGKGLVISASALSGDATTSGSTITLATVNSNVGSFGSSTSIPSFTVNAKGLITAAGTNVVIAPAGTLTGTTLASNVVTSSLTSVGTITSGVWNGTAVPIANGGTGQTTALAAFNALSPMTALGDIIYGGTSGSGTRLPGNTTTAREFLTSMGTGSTAVAPTWGVLISGDIPNNAANTSGTASNITAATNTTLTSLPNLTSAISLSISGSQVGGFTQGSVIFGGATGALAQDNSNFFWNDTTFNLGLGIIPATTVSLDIVNSNGTSKAIQTTAYGVGSSIPFRGRFARGTSSSPAAVQAGDNLSVLSGRGYGASQFAAASTGAINIVAGETFTNTSNATYLQFEVTPTGSVTLAEAMRLNSTGNLLIGGTVDSGTQKLQVTGNSNVGTVTGGTWNSTDIGVPYGGTGLSTTPTNGQLLIGNGTNYTLNTITAGTGISVTNAAGSITITNNTASPFTTKTANYVILSTDGIIFCDTSGGAFTLTLPSPAGLGGHLYRIIDSTGFFQTNNLTLAPNASEKIEGLAASKVLQTPWGGFTVTTNGTDWFVLG